MKFAASEGLRYVGAIVAGLACCGALVARLRRHRSGGRTGGASRVGFGSADAERDSVNPRAATPPTTSSTGRPRRYGLQTGILDAGAGTKGVHVAVAIAGLTPLTRYHYRLVAVERGGSGYGADKTLHTTKVPLSLAIFASPNPVVYDGTIVVQGTLARHRQRQPAGGAAGHAVSVHRSLRQHRQPAADQRRRQLLLPRARTGGSDRVPRRHDHQPTGGQPRRVRVVDLRVSASAGRIGERGKALFHGVVSPAMDGAEIAVMRQMHGKRCS